MWIDDRKWNAFVVSFNALAQYVVDHFAKLEKGVNAIMVDQATIQAKLDKQTADIAAEDNLIGGAIAAIGTLQQMIQDLRNNPPVELPQAIADQLDAMDKVITDRTPQIAAAILQGTPAPAPGAPPITAAQAQQAAQQAVAGG